MPEFEIRHVPRQDIAAIRLSSSMEDISTTMGEGFATLFGALEKAGVEPAGMPLARYWSFGGPTIEFECGVPVAAPFPGEGEVRPAEIGGGEAAVGLHVGPYDTLSETYEAMGTWIAQQGRKPGTVMWEAYLTDPDAEPDSSRWRTEVYWPVE